MSLKTFMSYSAEDAEIVYRVWDILTRIGIKSYAYKKFPKPGEPINESVMKAMKTCRCVIVFLTKTGAKSHWVNQEVGAAVALNKKVIPILENGVEWKGFIAENVEHISYNPLEPDSAVCLLVKRLREILKLERNIPNGLAIRCGSCQSEFPIALPSNSEIEDATKEKRNFNVPCPNGHVVEISASTLEPVWLLRKFQKALFKKRIARMITLLARQDIPSILIESISLARSL